MDAQEVRKRINPNQYEETKMKEIQFLKDQRFKRSLDKLLSKNTISSNPAAMKKAAEGAPKVKSSVSRTFGSKKLDPATKDLASANANAKSINQPPRERTQS